ASSAPAPNVATHGPAVVAAATSSSPAVRRLAAETGIDPGTLAGSGKSGRVTKGDMIAAAEGERPETKDERKNLPAAGSPGPSSLTARPSPAAARQTRRKMTPLRQKI